LLIALAHCKVQDQLARALNRNERVAVTEILIVLGIMVDGYYQNFPSRVRVRFYHENNKLVEPEISLVDLQKDIPLPKGVLGVGGLILQKDSPLYRYVKPMETVRGSQRLTDAAVYARAYIEACASPEAKALDERASSGIGGRTHMATNKPTGGFQWVPGFEPANEST
jgi:hypothetical protein